MLSRHADSCYWIGRYVERAEATARMVDVHYHMGLEADPVSSREADLPSTWQINWESILAISGSADDYYRRYGVENDRDALYFFAFDPEQHSSILRTWMAARENARTIRDQIASEMWESLNVAYLRLREWNVERVLRDGPHEFFQIVKNSSHLFQGILNRTLLMGESRDWLDTGRFLERACQTARLLDVKYHDLLPGSRSEKLNGNGAPGEGVDPLGVGGPLDMHGWIAVLKSVSAFEMYRKTHRDGIRPAYVVDFLVLNSRFPASVRHCVSRVEGCLGRISGNRSEAQADGPERLVGRLLADLTYSLPDEIILNGLHAFLDDTQRRCAAIGNAITAHYLSY